MALGGPSIALPTGLWPALAPSPLAPTMAQTQAPTLALALAKSCACEEALVLLAIRWPTLAHEQQMKKQA